MNHDDLISRPPEDGVLIRRIGCEIDARMSWGHLFRPNIFVVASGVKLSHLICGAPGLAHSASRIQTAKY